MSEPNEQPGATRQGDGSTQHDTEGRAEATEAAERRAQELNVDLTNVEGTGSGGRITAPDVEHAHRETDTSGGAIETRQRELSGPLQTPPSRDDIQRQYVVLKATLAGPVLGTVPLRIIKEDGFLEEPITDDTFPDNPTNFFAPEPLPAGRLPDQVPVKWVLPRPQRPIPTTLPGTSQRCRREECLPDSPIG